MLSFGNNGRCKVASRLATRGMAVVGLVVASVVVGCGGGGKPAVQPTAEKEAPAKKTTTKSNEPSRSVDDGAVASKSSTGSTGSGGVRKSSRGIPYDAFFDDPLAEVNNTAAVPMPSNAAKTDTAATEPTAKPATDGAQPTAGGGTAWADIISIDVVQAETKRLLNHLNSVMQKPGDFNKDPKEIGWEGAQLAGLAGVALEHGEAANWKKNAHYVRDFGSDLSKTAVGPGKEFYEKSKVAYEKMTSVFGGSIPADAGEVAAKRPFHETADRTGLMKRIEKARDWLRLNINTEAKLKSESDAILHEAMIIATYGKIIATEGYTSADEEDYKKYAEALIGGAQEAVSAAKDQSFQKFTDALNKVNKSCGDCHLNYGNG
ncbi:MAG: hypothetical protein AABP62_13095 [Planctomycetota bacterium]